MHNKRVFRHIPVIAAAMALLLTACAEEVEQKNGQSVPMNLAAVGEAALTRAQTDIQGKLFKADQLINAYISIDGASDGTTSLGNPVVLKTAAPQNGVNALSPNDGSVLYFPPGDNVKASIYALYPPEVTVSQTTFEVRNPQTTDDDYIASDLMHAATTTPKTDQTVHLQFAHKMAKLIVNATGEDGLTMNKITLKSLYTQIEWAPATGVLGSSPKGEKHDIVIAEQGEYAATLSGTALFPPQTKDDTYFMEVECSGPEGTGTAFFLVATKEFETGKVYTVNMKIGPKNLKDDGVVTIAPWPASVGTVNVEAVGNLGLSITSLADDNNSTTNTMAGSGLEGYYTYNGKFCTPILTVTDGKEEGKAKTLTKGVDYDVTYYNNINAGTALTVVTGKGDYAGLSTFTTFNIHKAANTMAYPAATKEVNLSKNAIVDHRLQFPAPTRSDGTAEVYGNMTYRIYDDAAMTNDVTGTTLSATIDDYGNVSMQARTTTTLYVKATMDDTGNFEAKTVSYALTIIAGDVSKTTTLEWHDPGSSFEYTGSPIEPANFVVKDNGNTLASGVDYTVSYGTNNQNVCTEADQKACVIITGMGEYSGTKNFYFTITKAANSWTTLNKPSVPMGAPKTANSPQGTNTMALSLPAQTFKMEGAAKFGTPTYGSSNAAVATVSAAGVITAVAMGSATITASVAATTNYEGLSETVNVTVEEKNRIYVYNGTTTASGSLYYQNQGCSSQQCAITFAADATLTACVVGAGGGNDGSGRGGQGGLVIAKKAFSANASVSWFVFCGGGGSSSTTGVASGVASEGGWPGGGRPGTAGSSGAGGGATVIATTASTDNWDFTANDSRLLVAGAGGGSSNGGNGGEPAGVFASTTEVKNPGSMYHNNISGRAKWMGGRTNVSGEVYADPTEDGGAGGAGYYGGMAGAEVNSGNTVAAGGHGGSNFIKSDWTMVFNGVAGSEAGTTYTPTTAGGFTVQYNGHKKDEVAPVIYRVWPGYVMIKYTYDIEATEPGWN